MSALRLFEFDSNVDHDVLSPLWDSAVVCNTFNRHPVYDIIFSCTDAQTLFAMACVSHCMRGAVKDYVKRAFNVNRLLSRFFSDPMAFRSLQARAATLISGSVALQFFDRTFYPESDLDLYPHQDHILELGRFLERDGYNFMPNSWQKTSFELAVHSIHSLNREEGPANDVDDQQMQQYAMHTIQEVYTFQRPSTDARNPIFPAKVQIIHSKVSPFDTILGFHSTCVMNVIAYDAAYSLYPYATFQERESLVISDNEKQGPALRKYSARGWTLINNLSPLLFLKDQGPKMYRKRYSFNKSRWVDDAQSWVIPLDTDGVFGPVALSPSSEVLTWDPVKENGWTLDDSLTGKSLCLETRHTTSKLLHYKYLLPMDGYLDVLIDFFKAQGPVEYSKADARSPTIPQEMYWTWWDAALPLLRKNYLMSLEKTAESAEPLARDEDDRMDV